MKAFCLISFCVLLSTSMLSAQQLAGRPTQESLSSLAFLKPGSTGFQTFSNVNRTKGNPFLLEDWQVGQIRFAGGKEFSVDIDVLLDMEQNKFYVRFDDGKMGEFPIWKIGAVRVFPNPTVQRSGIQKLAEGVDTLHYEVHNLYQETGNGPDEYVFYQVLYDGNHKLMYWHKKYLMKEKYIENVGIVRRPDEYRVLASYWLLDGATALEVKKNAKALQKALPRKSSQIKRHIKQKKLNIKNVDDLVRLFQLLDS